MGQLIHIEEYSNNIPLLLKGEKAGTIHSIFKNGLNIRFSNRLLFIGTKKNGKQPFGAHIQAVDYVSLKDELVTNSPVFWDDSTKTLKFRQNDKKLSFLNGKIYCNKIKIVDNKNNSKINKAIKTIEAGLLSFDPYTGLDVPIEQFLIDFLAENNQSIYIDETLYTKQLKLIDLLSPTKEVQDEEVEETLRYFLGRGQGLTPSGDDHLVGILAVQASFAKSDKSFNKLLEKILLKEQVTTDVALEYLLYALKGQFNSYIVEVMNNLQENPHKLAEKLEQLLQVGNSSGVDTIFGILLGLLAVRRK